MVATEEPKVSAPPTPDSSTPPKKAEMVVVNTENTEFSAGVVGGIAGKRYGGRNDGKLCQLISSADEGDRFYSIIRACGWLPRKWMVNVSWGARELTHEASTARARGAEW